MGDHLTPAIVALLAAVPVALVLFVPFVAREYRRRGRLSGGRLLLWLTSPVYAMALWTYTLLPLPEPDAVRCSPMQLRPGQFIADIASYDVSGVSALLHNPAVQQVALNVILFVPLGLYLRWLWGRGVMVSTLAALGLSLLIEVTQLTGVFGLYACAYRVFDVDDLLANTVGGLVGGAVAALFARRGRNDEVAVPTRVTGGRRVVGMLSDLIAVGTLGVLAGMSTRLFELYVIGADAADPAGGQLAEIASWVVPLVVCGAVAMATGRTIGDLAVGIRFGQGRAIGILRYLTGIGGFQLLGLLGGSGMFSGLDALFALVSLIVALATRDHRGLPGLILRRRVEIAPR